MTYFLVTSIYCSLRFLLLFLLQLLRTGLCQLHSTSACLGSVCYFHSSSLLLRICSTQSFICSSYRDYFSLGSLISLFWNSSEYSTTLCSSIQLRHHWNSLQALICLSSSSRPTMYQLHSLTMCFTVSVYPIHLLHHACSCSYSWCLVFRVLAEPSYPVLILNMYRVSWTLSLLSLRYSAYFWVFLSDFSSQKSYIVLNSQVLFRAISILTFSICFMTFLFHS